MEHWTLWVPCEVTTVVFISFLSLFPPRQSIWALTIRPSSSLPNCILHFLPSSLSSLFLVIVGSGWSQVRFGVYPLWRIMERFLKSQVVRNQAQLHEQWSALLWLGQFSTVMSQAGRSHGLTAKICLFMIEEGIWKRGNTWWHFFPFHINALIYFPHIRGVSPMAFSHREAKRFPICAPSQGSRFSANSRQCWVNYQETLSAFICSPRLYLPSTLFFKDKTTLEHGFFQKSIWQLSSKPEGRLRSGFFFFPNTGIKLT